MSKHYVRRTEVRIHIIQFLTGRKWNQALTVEEIANAVHVDYHQTLGQLEFLVRNKLIRVAVKENRPLYYNEPPGKSRGVEIVGRFYRGKGLPR